MISGEFSLQSACGGGVPVRVAHGTKTSSNIFPRLNNTTNRLDLMKSMSSALAMSVVLLASTGAVPAAFGQQDPITVWVIGA